VASEAQQREGAEKVASTFGAAELLDGGGPTLELAGEAVDEALGQLGLHCRLLCLRHGCVLVIRRLRVAAHSCSSELPFSVHTNRAESPGRHVTLRACETELLGRNNSEIHLQCYRKRSTGVCLHE